MLKNRKAIRQRILKWFHGRQRNLPWLNQRTPYGVWVSEIMLQQTQIVKVVEYYPRFIKRFPSVQKLAAASEQEVLSQWEGLGYYRRARQMYQAAHIIVDQHDGVFPTDFEFVVALPGIGRYTAGAILSIALDQCHPILEGNTIRLFSRWIGLQEDAYCNESQNRLWQISRSLLPPRGAGDFNQALMDFGREVCRPKNPDCQSCCLKDFCIARIRGWQHAIPHKPAKIKYEDLNEAILLVKRGNKILMRRCLDGERWAGLWDFPRFSSSRIAKLQTKVLQETGLNTQLVELDFSIKHAVTRYRIRLDCYQSTSVKGKLRRESRFQWKTAAEIEELPLNVTGRKFARKFL